MGFFTNFMKEVLADEPSPARRYDSLELIEYFKQEITGHTSALHPERTTTIHELTMEQLKELNEEIASFEINHCNHTIKDMGEGICKIELACSLFAYDKYGNLTSCYVLDATVLTNYYAELVKTEAESSTVSVKKR